ncbi:hypothetical protein G6F22_015428 [Rhizopus arrhizus]|nr:hypothetical protein G6F22_015428 [Rhizopus arrhizus]
MAASASIAMTQPVVAGHQRLPGAGAPPCPVAVAGGRPESARDLRPGGRACLRPGGRWAAPGAPGSRSARGGPGRLAGHRQRSKPAGGPLHPRAGGRNRRRPDPPANRSTAPRVQPAADHAGARAAAGRATCALARGQRRAAGSPARGVLGVGLRQPVPGRRPAAAMAPGTAGRNGGAHQPAAACTGLPDRPGHRRRWPE